MIKENLIEIYENSFKTNWDLPALSEYGVNKTYYYKDLAGEIARLHILFDEIELKKGDKIALVGKNTIQWCSTYLAVVTYGAIIVPILQDFHPDNIHHIVNHSDSVLLFTSEPIWDNLDESLMPNTKGIFSLTDFKVLHLTKKRQEINQILVNWNSLLDTKYPKGFSVSDIVYKDIDNSEVVLINYTSGTTGFSKGVMLTANNLAGNITYVETRKLLSRGQRILSSLPLAHAYGCILDFLFPLSVGVHITLFGKSPAPKIFAQACMEVKPNLIVTVPLIMEKIYRKLILSELENKELQLKMKDPILQNNIYAKIHEILFNRLGGELSHVVIGGAALNKEVEDFLYKIKFPFTVGYGMTECGPLIAYDAPHDFIPSSCGKILDKMQVRVDSADPYTQIGEIQVKGENVMKGYYKNEEATKDAFTEDGWLKTGDLGTINKENRIFLRGRCKTTLLGSSGQNIYPEELEAKLNNMLYVMESLIVQRDGKLIALIYPDFEALDSVGLTTSDLDRIMDDNKNKLNGLVANYEQISAIQIYPNEFEKTPKKSIKRYLYQ